MTETGDTSSKKESLKALQQDYRNAIGLFATGVTVLIIESEGEVHCMTANAVSSLSLDPIQLIVCPSKTAVFSKHIAENKVFTVNILGIHQENISNHYAGTYGDVDTTALEEPLYDYLFSNNIASPRLKDCIASFACNINKIHDGGDHWLVVAEVEDIYKNENDIKPLLFFGGKYHYPLENEEEHIQPSADPYQ